VRKYYWAVFDINGRLVEDASGWYPLVYLTKKGAETWVEEGQEDIMVKKVTIQEIKGGKK
jgi:hypothetical protein